MKNMKQFLLLLTTLFCEINSDPMYTSGPGIIRTYEGENAQLTWKLNTSLDDFTRDIMLLDKEDYLFIRRNRVCNIYNSRRVKWNGYWFSERYHSYETRSRLTFTENSTFINFELANIGSYDVGQYEYSIKLTSKYIHNSDAWIFTYGTIYTPAFSAHQDITEGAIFTMTCNTTSKSEPIEFKTEMIYTWTRDGQPLPDRHSTSGDGGQQLTINPVSREDHQKRYRCLVTEQGSRFNNSNEIILIVKFAPTVEYVWPPVQTVKAANGESIIFVVSVLAYPLQEAHVTWRLSGSTILAPGTDVSLYDRMASLSIVNITSSHYGNYTLIVNNGIGMPLVRHFSLSQKSNNLYLESTTLNLESTTERSKQTTESLVPTTLNMKIVTSVKAGLPAGIVGGFTFLTVLVLALVIALIVVIIRKRYAKSASGKNTQPETADDTVTYINAGMMATNNPDKSGTEIKVTASPSDEHKHVEMPDTYEQLGERVQYQEPYEEVNFG